MKLAKLKTLEAVYIYIYMVFLQKRICWRGSFMGYIEWNKIIENMRTHGTCMLF